MSNAYRTLMEQQYLSEQADQVFYERLQQAGQKKQKPFRWKAAVVAACVLLMIPIGVFAAETIFGISVVELVKGETSTGVDGTGYEVSYPEVASHPLSDFSQAIQTMDGAKTVIYDTWQDAEAELGFPLVNNPVLFGENTGRTFAYDLSEDGIPGRVHCFASYNGEDNQLYRATVCASYGYRQTNVTLRATVTCDHPAISPERAQQYHWHGVLYEERDAVQITQEQYTAANGINATVITVERTGNNRTDYEASFAANGASYRITVSPRDPSGNEEAKEALCQILEGFVF